MCKIQDPQDKRAYPLFPMVKAKEVYDIIIEEEKRLTQLHHNGFDKGQQEEIPALIQKMRQNIENDEYDLKNYKTTPTNK